MGVLEDFAASASFDELSAAARSLDVFARDTSHNLYQRVRAIFQTYALYRYLIPARPELPRAGRIPHEGQELLLDRHYAAAIDVFLAQVDADGLSDPLASALAAAYHGLGFQILAEQVQRSVRSQRGNRWMFRTGHALDHPLRVRDKLKQPDADGVYPVLVERTPVRMDLTHSGWSDIFFLGMDYPEGARVLNVSVDLAVHGRDEQTAPPITCFLRVIDEPVLRLASVDLDAVADLRDTSEVFDFASDYLGLLKAAVIASGLVPPGLEGSGQPLSLVLEQLVGPGRGIELVSQVNDIPKGSRLAVSTNLLGGLIAVCMRATGQTESLTGSLTEAERRLVAGRAILGEWLGGSGGGWQDSGGVWPGIKLIEGVRAGEGDPEFGSARAALAASYPARQRPHLRRGAEEARGFVGPRPRRHGANVGPILEMVTEKYLLGTASEWDARQERLRAFDSVVEALAAGDMRELGRLTTRIFEGRCHDHSLGLQPLHRVADRRRARQVRRRFLGLLDARRHVRRRHGLHLRSEGQTPSRARDARHHASAQERACVQPAVRDGAGRVPLCHQLGRHCRGAADGFERAALRGVLPVHVAALVAGGVTLLFRAQATRARRLRPAASARCPCRAHRSAAARASAAGRACGRQ